MDGGGGADVKGSAQPWLKLRSKSRSGVSVVDRVEERSLVLSRSGDGVADKPEGRDGAKGEMVVEVVAEVVADVAVSQVVVEKREVRS